MSSQMKTSSPPPGVQDGGAWGMVKYAGEKTNLMCLVLCLLGGILTGCGACAYLCPQDEKDAYKVGNSVYDSNGRLIGTTAKVDFTAHPAWKRPFVAAAATENNVAAPTESQVAAPTKAQVAVPIKVQASAPTEAQA